MTSLLMCCRTQQSSEQKTTVVATDTTKITQVAAQDSASIIARVDSIIIEEYNTDEQENITPSVSQNKPGLKCSSQKRNDISQNKVRAPTKKIKVYGVNLSSTRLANKDYLNKQTAHQEKTISQVKQKTPTKSTAVDKIIYVIIGITLLLFAGYLYWKNAVQ